MSLPQWLQLHNLGNRLSKLTMLKNKRPTDNSLSAVSVLRACEGSKIHIISQIPARVVVITSDNLNAKSICEKLKSYEQKDTYYLKHRDDVLIHRRGVSSQGVKERLICLSAIASGKAEAIVMSCDALLQYYPKKELITSFTIDISVDDEISPIILADKLSLIGYNRQDSIEEEGDFSLRGDVLDIYSFASSPIRICFFDEIIETIKTIDVLSKVSIMSLDSIQILPTSDILMDNDTIKKTRERLLKNRDSQYALDINSQLKEGALLQTAVWALPFMKECTSNIFDYFDDDIPTVYIFDEPKIVHEKLSILYKEFSNRFQNLLAGNEILQDHENSLVDRMEIKRNLLIAKKMSFSSLDVLNPIFEPKLNIEPKTRSIPKYYLDPKNMVSDLISNSRNGFKIIVCCGSKERAKGVFNSLLEEKVLVTLTDDINDDSSILITSLKIEIGFAYTDLKVMVVGVKECIGKTRQHVTNLPKQQFVSPKQGEYVVHRVHGVGICDGLKIMNVGGYEREYIVLKYRDGDTLFVASDQMDSLQKFVGEEHPKLNKIGGKEFEKEKDRVRKSLKKLAVNLCELYAIREKQKGFTYSADTVWQAEFEDNFEYEETPDQLKAIQAIKEDMEKGKIMDRLVVGDVGFGKTEIAFRAMFKTILDNKQSVLLVPTTILARQHYENLILRLEPFGVRCKLMTRLQSAKENENTIKELGDGTLHMVISTHKVLAKHIQFFDLGLLVLDEEQRFGVEHKEKIKERYPLINVLTLSATPIPRTLNMALSGVRDISMLETAPIGRLPVQTYVVTYSDSLCVDVVTREMARGGQTFILVNDISKLDSFANHLGGMLSEDVRIVVAHGQLPRGVLESRITAFYEKKFDVLISTTIIENGIDLPDANSLIVIKSGNFGLSQLYQLRGRVGRRGVLAHAYFTLPQGSGITPDAEKRLKALMDNTEIGSGFKIALSDLSIRGAGNLLGAEQHGHIERVGYEMYLELLDEAIEEVKTGSVHKRYKEMEIKIDAPAFIKDNYIGARDKLRVYKQISKVYSLQAREDLIKEFTEVYGEVDGALENLIDIALLKNLAREFDVEKIIINKNGAGVFFVDGQIFKNQALMGSVTDHKDSVVLTTNMPPSLIFDVNKLPPQQKIKKLLNFFLEAANN